MAAFHAHRMKNGEKFAGRCFQIVFCALHGQFLKLKIEGQNFLCYNQNDKSEAVGGKSMGKISVLFISVPLMIAAIVCVLLADRIDAVVKGDKKLKKVMVVFGGGVLFICTFALAVSFLT